MEVSRILMAKPAVGALVIEYAIVTDCHTEIVIANMFDELKLLARTYRFTRVEQVKHSAVISQREQSAITVQWLHPMYKAVGLFRCIGVYLINVPLVQGR